MVDAAVDATIDEYGERGHGFLVRSSWCPRCGSDLVAPGMYSSSWRCSRHGDVLPLTAYHRLDAADIDHVTTNSDVPLWLPDPPPLGWMLAGLGAVGDARSRIRATVTAFHGEAPLGGPGEWLVVAEEPGIGLGETYASVVNADPAQLADCSPPAKVHANGHPTSLWSVPSEVSDRSAYLGEAGGVWLWLISFPADAGYAVLEDLILTDARQGVTAGLPVDKPSERIRPVPAG
jgi:hypothetical protein